ELAGVFMRWAPVFLDALAYTYRVTLQTGTETAAGTNDQIVIELRDSVGTVLARRSYLGDLENGVTDIVYLKPLTAGGGVPGEVASVIIRRSLEIGLGGDWYLASVTVDNLVTGQSTTYPVNQWIEARTDYELS
ncbi:MAG: PLAT/LH2 domain-containing protein, partial [Actinomycetota bacterium]